MISMIILNAINEIAQVEKDLASLWIPAVKLMYVVCGIIGLFGAAHIYSKMQSGERIAKELTGYLGGIIFVIAAVVIVKSIFITNN